MSSQIEIERRQEIESALPAGNEAAALSFVSYRLDEALIQHLQLAAEALSRRAGRPDFLDALFSTGRVMALNSLRANVKEVVFRENGYARGDLDQYRLGLAAFRIALSAGHKNLFGSFAPKFKEFDLPVELVLCHHPRALIIEAVNRFELNRDDELTIRKKLERARTTYDLFQFFEEGETEPSSHETIFRAATALENLGLRPSLTVVNHSGENRTRAVLLLPLNGTGPGTIKQMIDSIERGGAPCPEPALRKTLEL